MTEPESYPEFEARLAPPLDEKMVREVRDVEVGPRWTTREVAKVFFGGVTPQLVSWYKGLAAITPERVRVQGRPIETVYYNLGEIEMMAHAVARRGIISGGILAEIVTMIWSMCEVYGVPYLQGEEP